jgi:hypothetical protein
MKTISDETWMKAASSGFNRPNAAKPSPHAVHEQCADEVCPDDAAASPGDGQRLHELEQVIYQEDHIRALAGNVRSRSHRHADAGFRQCPILRMAVTA